MFFQNKTKPKKSRKLEHKVQSAKTILYPNEPQQLVFFIFLVIKVTAILIRQFTPIGYHYILLPIVYSRGVPMIYAVDYTGNFKHVAASRFVGVHKGWQTNENTHCISIVLVSIAETMRDN